MELFKYERQEEKRIVLPRMFNLQATINFLPVSINHHFDYCEIVVGLYREIESSRQMKNI